MPENPEFPRRRAAEDGYPGKSLLNPARDRVEVEPHRAKEQYKGDVGLPDSPDNLAQRES